MQTAAHLHHHVPDTVFPQADCVFDHSAAFDTTDYVFGHDPALGNRAMVCFLRGGPFATLWLLKRARMLHTLKQKAQKAYIVD